MRLAALATGLFLALTGFAAAQPYDTPEALLEAFYQPYMDGNFAEDDSMFRSAALQALYDNDAESTPIGEMGALDFDPYVDGQDFDVTNLVIGTPEIDGETAVVEVSFDNFGQNTSLTYDLVFEDGGWRIDDVANDAGEYPYRLTEIFAASTWN